MSIQQPKVAISSATCANCGSAHTAEYCAHCGQRQRGRLGSRQLLGEAVDQLFSLESRFWRTAIELFRNPGAVARAYVGGQRASYVNPFKYCLALLAAYLVLGAALGVDPSETVNASFTEGGEKVAWADDAQAFVRTNLNNILFIALPLFAGTLRLIYRRSGYNFAETYAFVLFVVGQIFLVSLLLTPIGLWQAGAAILMRMVVHLVLFVWAAMVFYEQRTVLGLVRAVIANTLYFLSIVPVAAGFLLFYAAFLRG